LFEAIPTQHITECHAWWWLHHVMTLNVSENLWLENLWQDLNGCLAMTNLRELEEFEK
jgi:hypothetical protein